MYICHVRVFNLMDLTIILKLNLAHEHFMYMQYYNYAWCIIYITFLAIYLVYTIKNIIRQGVPVYFQTFLQWLTSLIINHQWSCCYNFIMQFLKFRFM